MLSPTRRGVCREVDVSQGGLVEVWTGPAGTYAVPLGVLFEMWLVWQVILNTHTCNSASYF